jgi:glutathione S-transferase
MPLMDSSAILETLDEMTGSIWPRDRMQRIHVRNASALLVGMIQAMVALFLESSMHEVPSPFWMQDHHDTIRRARERALRLPLWIFIQDQQLTQAGWDLAVAKEYLEFRVKDLSFPEDHSILKEVLNLAMKDPAFQESKPKL